MWESTVDPTITDPSYFVVFESLLCVWFIPMFTGSHVANAFTGSHVANAFTGSHVVITGSHAGPGMFLVG